MTTTITAEAFAVLAAQTGLKLSEAQKATLLAIWPTWRAVIGVAEPPLR